MTGRLFQNFDFSILDSPDFKEDSVREEIIQPILKELGYSASGDNRIIRGKPLPHPHTMIGSQKHKYIVPDYVLQAQGKNAWVLDAKAPSETIETGDNVAQVHSYAVNIAMRVGLFALCNGREFIVFISNSLKIELRFSVAKINYFWPKLNLLLSPQAFERKQKEESSISSEAELTPADFDYTVEKEIGLLWSHRADKSEYSEIVRFKGRLLAETRTEDINGPTWYELYRLQNGRYVVHIIYNHRCDYGGADLIGVNAWGEIDPPLTLERLQEEFPALAKRAGLVPIREFDSTDM